ncbi:TolC family outer membrane protein [Aliiroseovarius crassostreae]|uniref:TolC family outer membrane protein n=1 Tax=Aliiroseovarius crassostreae TaxID=154981 RepID=UPI0021AEFFF8|nr:TolC family outer membrane protein [Aliiroseovarius crassostreae]UWQ08777.1 TolC family outer membrane protein [Aliiroseovarius crassostreae]
MGFKGKFAGVTAAAIMAMTQGAWAESLADAMASAYKNSGLLQQNQAVLRAADEDVAIALSALRPVIQYSLSHGWKDTDGAGPAPSGRANSAELSASLLLYDFGRSQMGVEAQKQIVLATREALVGVEQNVLLRAVQAFLNVRSANENAALQANSVRVLTQELRAAQDRFEVGEVTQTDVANAQARLASARADEVAAQGQLAIAREEYRAAIGHLPKSMPGTPHFPKTAKSLSEAQSIARARHPNIRAAQYQVAAADLGIERARVAMKPSLRVGASTTLTDRIDDGVGANFNNEIGLSLSGDLYAGGRHSATYRKAIAQAEQARSALQLARLAVDQEVANAWSQMAIATASLEATDRQIRAGRVALRGTREEATLGSRTTLDVLNAEQALRNAEAARISAQSSRYLAAYSLLASMGLLTAEHLNLGVVSYDAEAYYNAVRNAPVRKISPQGERLDAIISILGRQ